MKKFLKCIAICLVMVFCLTGCDSKEDANERITQVQKHMNEIKNYLAEVTITYSDEEQNINGTIVSFMETENKQDWFEGRINYNGEVFETIGKRENNKVIMETIDGTPLELPFEVPRIMDLKITNIREITDRAGDKNKDYFLVTLNDKYEAKIGVGEDNIIYTISIDLKDQKSEKLVSVYKLDIEIKDEYREMETKDFSQNTIIEGNSFFDLFVNTDKLVTNTVSIPEEVQ